LFCKFESIIIISVRALNYLDVPLDLYAVWVIIKIKMGVCETATNILTRGVVQIIYSSTTGTSKRTADQLQEFLEANQYIALITNIGDLDTDEYVNHRGTVIFLLSTYGDGSSPLDGQVFL
jgi:sulfite reductase alpha subunit-like flavoprotein